MASYLQWNDAIAEFFSRGLGPNDAFYLSLDEDSLAEISEDNFEDSALADPVRDFEQALRTDCVVTGRRISLPRPRMAWEDGVPPSIAFLAAMVLAAHRMAPEDDIADINYFTRLREIFGIDTGDRGRPSGLNTPGAPEEVLWRDLNRWVIENGWQPSAERGPEGPTKFTNYPLSQSLLREGDRAKLEHHFREAERELGQDADSERVGSWFLNRATGFSTSHIRNLAQEATADRYEAIVDAVYDVYTSIDWDRPSSTGSTVRSRRRLMAGLYRDADPLWGSINYHLFPRRHRRDARNSLSVVRNGTQEPLHQERDGQFRPLWPVDPAGDRSYAIVGDPRIVELHLPARDFWVLSRDRFDDSSGIFASRGAPQLGETFLLLCRRECEEQLNILRGEGLIEWDREPEEIADYPNWLEYRECMVLSANWDGIFPQIPELFNELRPRSRASISLTGGLKTGRRDTWIEGHMPEFSVTSFDPYVQVRVTDISSPDLQPVFEGNVTSNRSAELPTLKAGDYRVEVLRNGNAADRRFVRVLSWDDLEKSDPTEPQGTEFGEYILQGALVRIRDGQNVTE